MLQYQAPERDLEFLLFELFEVQKIWANIPALRSSVRISPELW